MSSLNRLEGDEFADEFILKKVVCMTNFDFMLGLTTLVSAAEIFEVPLSSVGETGLARVCLPEGRLVLGGCEVIMFDV